MLSFQYCIWNRLHDETTENSTGKQKVKATECKCKENNRRLK